MEKEKQLRKEKENLNHEPLVTVCISHHERIELLAELLKGLFRNEYSNLEIIIIDDASSPNTQRQLDKVIAPLLTYPPPLFDSSSHHLRGGWKIIKQQASLYLGATRNRCFSHSKGDYVLFLDDDDVPKPDHIRKAVDVAHHTNAGLISTFFELFPGGTGFPGDETTSAPISTR